MKSFLNIVCDNLKTKFGADISELCLVVPNKRAILFLKKQLSESYSQTIFSPKILSSEEFVNSFTDNTILDNTTLQFELYKSYREIVAEPQSFEEFNKWSTTLLHDYNEVDSYLIDSNKIFSHLSEAYAYKIWNLNPDEPLTDFQKKYLDFWDSLGKIYFQFNANLKNSKQSYQGMVYREVATTIDVISEKINYKKTIFIGFNALNKSEETIISYLLNSNKAEIYWDSDSYYLDDEKQEAGMFLRNYKKEFSNNSHFIVNTDFDTTAKQINLIACPKQIAQARVVGNLLHDFNGDLKNTALVLADENLLIPIISSLPETIGNFNITMGYPLKNTPIYNLASIYLDAVSSTNKGRLYHKSVIKLLSNPIFEIKGSVIKKLIELNKTYLYPAEILDIDSENNQFSIISNTLKAQKPEEAIVGLQQIIEIVKQKLLEKSEANKETIEAEHLHSINKLIKQLENLSSKYKFLDNLKSLKQVFETIANGITIPFIGEPLQGLQIMGMLETRTLDFSTIILVSANEGILPKGKSQNSFIPYDIKKTYDLPTHSEKDAVYAYHFYRLLQRADNIYITYNTSTDDYGGSEKSRYLIQLQNEAKNISFEEQILSIPIVNSSEKEIKIHKNEFIINKLTEIAETKSFSPSTLNTYIACSLKFYFSKILKLSEEKEIAEEIGNDVLGIVVHSVLQNFYTPFVDKTLMPDDVKAMLPRINAETELAFEQKYKNGDTTIGKNLLIVKVAEKFIKSFLNAEIKLLEQNEQVLQIKALEKSITTATNINGRKVNFKGFADRIDILNGVTRIIDYKTGSVMPIELQIKDWELLITDKEYSKAFQVLLYAFMYYNSSEIVLDKLESSIISMRSYKNGTMPLIINGTTNLANKELMLAFNSQLNILISNIFNIEIPFEQTDDISTCEFCEFKNICNK